MTKHDKIWILNKAQEFALRDKDGYSPGCIEGPVICMTIKELKEMWNAGRQHLREAMQAERTEEPELIVSPNFETYLTSKGIHIP